MSAAQSTTLQLETALDQLEQYVREGKHAERLRLATQLLKLHPDAVMVHVHRVTATLEVEGVDAARASLRLAARGFFDSGEMLSEAFLEVYRTLAMRGVMLEDAEPEYDGEILEVSPALPSGLYRVTFSSGGATQMSATLLERMDGLRVGAGLKTVH